MEATANVPTGSVRTVEDLIREKVKSIGKTVYIAPEIPDKKLNNAIVGMTGSSVDPDYVVAVIDSTVLGKSDDGVLFTGDAMYWHPFCGDICKIKFADLKSASVGIERKTDNKGKVKETEILHLVGKDDAVIVHRASNDFYVKKMVEFLNETIIMGGVSKNAFESTRQTAPLCASSVQVKIAYVKLVVNFALSDDGEVDASEYSEIYGLMVRNDFSSEERVAIRGYVDGSNSVQSDEELINELKGNVSKGSFSTLAQSLIKDIIYLNYKKGKELESWSKNKYIINLANSLNVLDSQIEVMVQAIKNDEDILSERKSDTEIEKSMKELLAKAGAVGLPIAAIYFSGSVVGLSAAGITSGLATLGMGGILGFSGMVTGIGVVVLAGVGAYKGVKKITGQSDLENNKQRELMIQNIIKNHQKALNFLVDDVNYISARLIKTLSEVSENREKIDKLQWLLLKLSEASKKTTAGLLNGVKESIVAKLPKILDHDRLVELTDVPTLSKIRPVVYTIYKEKKDSEGESVYTIEYNHASDDYEKVYDFLKAVKYFELSSAVGAKFSSAFKKLIK